MCCMYIFSSLPSITTCCRTLCFCCGHLDVCVSVSPPFRCHSSPPFPSPLLTTIINWTYFQLSKWGLSNHLTTNHIWDAFIILSLLEDSVACSKLLSIPHIGSQTDQFKVAMEERSRWIILNGQPDAVQHTCDCCMQIFSMSDGSYSRTADEKLVWTNC